MSGTIKGELGQIADLKQTFETQSGNVEQLTSSVGGKVGSMDWEGPAFRRFEERWNSEFAPTLRELQTAMAECSVELGQRHDELQSAGT